MTNSAQGVDYAFSGSPPTSSQAPGAPRPHIGQGARDKSPQIPHTAASPAATEERSASVLRATSDLARDWVQLRERSAVPALALPMGCGRAGRPAQGGMRALLSPPVANAIACVRDPLPQKGFRRVAVPGCSMPGHFKGVRKLQRSGGPGKGRSG